MNVVPILCHGPELSGVLADIRSRGGVVTSLATGVGGPAGYRVSYFQAESKIAGAAAAEKIKMQR